MESPIAVDTSRFPLQEPSDAAETIWAMDLQGLSPSALDLLQIAEQQAVELQHAHLGTEHVVLAVIALSQPANGRGEDYLKLAREQLERIEPVDRRWRRYLDRVELEQEAPRMSGRLRSAIDAARLLAEADGRRSAEQRDIVLGVLDVPEAVGVALIERLGVNPLALQRRMVD